MKTKTSILTALIALASGAGAMAQVYSQNIVGYVNTDLVSGFNLIANPLVNSANAIAEVLPTAPEGALLYTFDSVSGAFTIDLYSGGSWYDFESEEVSTTVLAPGEGFFLYTLEVSTLTFVGEVATGEAQIPLNSGFTLVSSAVPQTYELVSPDFPASDGMLHYRYAGGGFEVSVYDSSVGWFDQVTEELRQVSAAPGEGFFIYTLAPDVWTRTFNVN